jgi:predicted nucleotidyltransferase
LFDIGGVQVEVSELLGVQVDVVTPAALPESWRSRIIAEARPL